MSNTSPDNYTSQYMCYGKIVELYPDLTKMNSILPKIKNIREVVAPKVLTDYLSNLEEEKGFSVKNKKNQVRHEYGFESQQFSINLDDILVTARIGIQVKKWSYVYVQSGSGIIIPIGQAAPYFKKISETVENLANKVTAKYLDEVNKEISLPKGSPVPFSFKYLGIPEDDSLQENILNGTELKVNKELRKIHGNIKGIFAKADKQKILTQYSHSGQKTILSHETVHKKGLASTGVAFTGSVEELSNLIRCTLLEDLIIRDNFGDYILKMEK